MNGTSAPFAARCIVIAAALFVAAPLAGLLQRALSGNGEVWGHLIAFVLPVAVADTAMLLCGLAVVCGVVGVGTAFLVASFRFPGRSMLAWLLTLPLAFPAYIVAYVYVEVLGAFGPVQGALRALFGFRLASDYWFPNVRSIGGAVFVMGFVLFPYVYLAALVMFRSQNHALAESARVVGASPWRVARDIVLPMARPAIAAGLMLVLLEALNDIGASEYLGVQTLTLSVFVTWLNRGDLGGAAQTACMLLIVVAVFVWLERRGRGIGRNMRSFAGHSQQAGAHDGTLLCGWRGWGATLACSVPVAFGFLIPSAYLAQEAIVRSLRNGVDADLLRHAASTFVYASGAVVVTLLLGFGASMAARLIARGWARLCVSFAGLGYALPGTVLALGLLTPFALVDDAFNAVARVFGGRGVGLVVAGSGAAIVIALSIRFLPIVTGLAEAGLARISADLDGAARTAGASARTMIATIHLPLLRPALAAAALIVFVDSLKELSIALLLRPLNVETLSTYVYQFAVRGIFEDAALAALLIVAIGIVPAMRTVRFARPGNRG
ncbi:iron ABC transporter permease [Roseiarcaceae bacterium H3SJ34-1]|uniref:ABC transporter permease n=1 Tax=Terripilifer ovatus TaxID=3032367 RepID=UPI003AB99E05|nr:iron ABC transporter permease [Roseiarcaceae bacterium H3SJ34-1]